MIRLVLKYFWLYIFLLLLQVLILNNLYLSIYINPYVYILLILLLPIEISGWLLLTIAFFTGLSMDAFCNTMGMHAAATVFMAFLRKYFLQFIAPRDGYESGYSPHYGRLGLLWFIFYAGILTFIHHLTLFIIEDFQWMNFFSIIIKTILSSILSLSIMLVLMLFSFKPRK